MYDISTQNVRKGENIYFVFLFVGFICFAFVAYYAYTTNQKEQTLDSSTMSTRIEITSYENDDGVTMYSPIYYYVVDNQEYSCSSTSSSSAIPSTKNDTVYYEKANPGNCMSNYSKNGNKLMIPFFIVSIICIVVSIVNFHKINKRVKKIKILNEKGKLVKNLPYRLEETKMVINNVPVLRPVVNYPLPSGTIITLYGDYRYDRKTSDNGMIDLVIDEKDPNNYFMDYSINRIGGNLANDYYNSQHELNIYNTQSDDINKKNNLGQDIYNPSSKY